MRVRDIKRWLAPLLGSPLHPQWLIRHGLRAEDMRGFAGVTVDIGCADQGVRHLLPQSAQYIGIDYLPTAVDWYRTEPHIFGDARQLPLADDAVDGAIMLHVLEHVDRSESALCELCRVIRPGGKALIEIPFLYPLHDAPLDYRRWSRYGISSDVEKAGLQVDRLDSIGRASETAALLFNLAIARLSLDLLNGRSPWLLVAPLLWLLVPLFNLLGWALAPLHTDSDFMPHRVRVLCSKPIRDKV